MLKIDVFVDQQPNKVRNSRVKKITSSYRRLLNEFEAELKQYNYNIRIDIINGRYQGINLNNIPQNLMAKIVDSIIQKSD